MTRPAPALMPSANGWRNGSSFVATRSVMPVDEKSVLLRIRPRPGKCFDGALDPALEHPLEERRRRPGHGLRRRAVLPSPPADRLVGGPDLLRDGVGDGGEVDVDARRLELPCPGGRLTGELGRLELGLLLGRRGAREALPAQLVHLAAFLVGGDHQPDVAGGARRHEVLEVGGRAGDLVGAVPAAEVDDVADVVVGDDVVEGLQGRVRVEPDHEELAEPLLRAQRLPRRGHARGGGVLRGGGAGRPGRRSWRWTPGCPWSASACPGRPSSRRGRGPADRRS